jgi:predicted dienelactone hydrolase
MPRSRFCPRLPALALGVTLVLGFASAAVAQTGVAQIEADGMPLRLVYPTALPARPIASGPFNLSVAPAAPPLPGPRRVVLISHGTGGNPLAEHALAARLAAAGFVVAQLLHRGDNNADVTAAGPESWRHRPREASAALDALAAHPDWGPRLRLDRVGVHGTSAGAVTAMTLVGAEWSLSKKATQLRRINSTLFREYSWFWVFDRGRVQVKHAPKHFFYSIEKLHVSHPANVTFMDEVA